MRVSSGRRLRTALSTIRPIDLALTVALVAVQVAATALVAGHQTADHSCWWGSDCAAPTHLDAGAFVLLAVGPLALQVRRRHPAPVLAVVFAATLLYATLGYAAGPVYLSLIVAMATAVTAGSRLAGWLAVFAGWALFPWLPYALGRSGPPRLVGVLALGAWLLVLLAAAEGLRLRRERAAEAERQREQEAVRRADEERLRIARELHDVLAHNVSLINVQSGVALHLLDRNPDQARTALAAINEASAEALREMRSVLGVLRRGDEKPPRGPTAGLARLPELVSRSSRVGVAVELMIEGQPRPLPASVDLAAFRIVQESLTNVNRHSHASSAVVRLGYRERELTVIVEDDGRGAPLHAGAESGNGIAGMRERTAALGGELDAGRRAGGGFSVRVKLPIEPER
jgi:signal transduction histidine kinase